MKVYCFYKKKTNALYAWTTSKTIKKLFKIERNDKLFKYKVEDISNSKIDKFKMRNKSLEIIKIPFTVKSNKTYIYGTYSEDDKVGKVIDNIKYLCSFIEDDIQSELPNKFKKVSKLCEELSDILSDRVRISKFNVFVHLYGNMFNILNALNDDTSN